MNQWGYNNGEIIKTTVGRLIFKEILPEPIGRFNPDFNKIYKKKEIKNLIFDTFKIMELIEQLIVR
ncbi:hypothetical protein [Marinitoga lauensis]|uniref:hypothetical protein n=1 Tax=Marinitoga lauensis TaxID=2201189 RepID=UPI001012C144|nr:hypothetical protein [Marinitoga lauensis]